MKKLLSIILPSSLILLTLFSGCRREDVREVTLAIPGLTSENQRIIVNELTKYDGVRKDSFQWDLPKKLLTLKYDSMKVAQCNLRYAIEEKGIKIDYPPKTDDHAGY